MTSEGGVADSVRQSTFRRSSNAKAKEEAGDGPDDEIYRDVSNVIDRLVRKAWFADQVLCRHYDEHKSAPLQDSYTKKKTVLPSGLRLLPMLPRRLTWWLQSRAVPSQQRHEDIVEQLRTNFKTTAAISVSTQNPNTIAKSN